MQKTVTKVEHAKAIEFLRRKGFSNSDIVTTIIPGALELLSRDFIFEGEDKDVDGPILTLYSGYQTVEASNKEMIR
ncbi:hypothetical protein ABEP42_13855 [Priestia megaterium]|uniref:hypothetical protein n=1 Tax=Priestia megaterium TaxID=1404 RepID=UPI00317D0744